MNLSDTVGLMMSDNYEDQFLAEYVQVKIRFQNLVASTNNHPYPNLFDAQTKLLYNYMHVLEAMAKVEGIDLSEEHIEQAIRFVDCRLKVPDPAQDVNVLHASEGQVTMTVDTEVLNKLLATATDLMANTSDYMKYTASKLMTFKDRRSKMTRETLERELQRLNAEKELQGLNNEESKED